MNTINHIHIPRCSGIYIKTHIVNDLKVRKIPYFATNHGEIFSDTFNEKKFISGHFGLTPLKYRNDLINISLVRNPVDRFLSNFVYLHPSFKGAHLYAQLEAWVENTKQHNLQAKNLNKSLNENFYNSLNHGTQRANEGWCLEEGDLDIKEIKSFIDSMALIDTLENHSSFLIKLNNLIYDTYGFYSFSNKNAINQNFKTLEISNTIKTKIEELNSFDMEVYDYVKSTR
jgi:hypothetical protein